MHAISDSRYNVGNDSIIPAGCKYIRCLKKKKQTKKKHKKNTHTHKKKTNKHNNITYTLKIR